MMLAGQGEKADVNKHQSRNVYGSDTRLGVLRCLN